MSQGETQDCEVSLALPCPKTCKNLWRSCVDHHSFFSSNRTARSPKHNNSAVQSYRRMITQHLGLGNSKNERWACAGTCTVYSHVHSCHKHLTKLPSKFAVVQCASAWWEGWSGTQCCRGRFHRSILKPRVCPLDRPQPPPTGTTCRMNPNYNETLQFLSSESQFFILTSVRVLI